MNNKLVTSSFVFIKIDTRRITVDIKLYLIEMGTYFKTFNQLAIEIVYGHCCSLSIRKFIRKGYITSCRIGISNWVSHKMKLISRIISSNTINLQIHIISSISTYSSKKPYLIIYKSEFKIIIIAIREVVNHSPIFFHYITMYN